MRADQVAEILGQLRFREIVGAVVEIPAWSANGAGVSVDGLGLQALQLQVLEMAVVLPGKMRRELGRHAGLSSRNIAKSATSKQRGQHAG